MGRVSRSQAEENRRRVVETASHLIRERGTAVSVADLMAAAGLTHGGFYKQFASKGALVDEATAHAFDTLAARHVATVDALDNDRSAVQERVIRDYLSPAHRDDVADGCPVAALVTDVGREGVDPGAQATFTEGVREFAGLLDTGEGDGLTRLATMVGALLLARATMDNPLSEEVLAQARAALTAPAQPMPSAPHPPRRRRR